MSDVFLSTPSARRATCGMPYGTQPETISIHALREEGDRMPSTSFSRSSDFYPRPPRGGRLYRIPWTVWRSIFLSTPSARRATSTSSPRGTSRNDFYPRPPRGGRPRTRSSSWSITNFYPRPPRGGRRAQAHREGPRGTISIHALREEGDQGPGALHGVLRISIHALREEGDRCAPVLSRELAHISIHALREEGDVCQSLERMVQRHFYPRPPRGGRPPC